MRTQTEVVRGKRTQMMRNRRPTYSPQSTQTQVLRGQAYTSIMSTRIYKCYQHTHIPVVSGHTLHGVSVFSHIASRYRIIQ